jgi:hypothetical protein
VAIEIFKLTDIAMNLRDFNEWPEIISQDKIDNLIHELYLSNDSFGKEELFEILVEIGERFSKNFTTLGEPLRFEIMELIKQNTDFLSIDIIKMVIHIMFLFQLNNCFDYLTLEITGRPLNAEIKDEIIDALSEYRSSFL